MKFKCSCGRLIEIDFPKEWFEKGNLIIPCPKCNLKYEISEKEINPYRRSDPLRFLAINY